VDKPEHLPPSPYIEVATGKKFPQTYSNIVVEDTLELPFTLWLAADRRELTFVHGALALEDSTFFRFFPCSRSRTTESLLR
jgi:hypothetical protein